MRYRGVILTAQGWDKLQAAKTQTEFNENAGDRFQSMPLTIFFDPDWNYQLEDPLNQKHSRQFVNAQGLLIILQNIL